MHCMVIVETHMVMVKQSWISTVNYLPLLDNLNDDDLLILTADHGNDPTNVGTDHTREFVPMIAYSKSFKTGGKLPILETFADLGTTISDNFKVKKTEHGHSFLSKLK